MWILVILMVVIIASVLYLKEPRLAVLSNSTGKYLLIWYNTKEGRNYKVILKIQ